MSGYPHAPPPGHGYGQPPPGQGQPYTASPYPSAPPTQGQAQPYTATSYAYSAPPPPQGHQQQYAAPSAPYAPAPTTKPPKDKPHSYGGDNPYSYGAPPQPVPAYPPAGFGSPFASLVPSTFPPNTDPNVVACFQMADQDGSGLIDDKELQMALSSYNQGFSIRTVRLLIYLFTNSNSMKIGPKEFTALFYSLQSWRDIFERFDRDRSGKIDVNELRDALLSLGFAVSPAVLDLLVSKYDRSGGRNKAIEYDNFIECCLIVKGLAEKFKEKDTRYSGSATFTYESFMLTVLPFLMA